MMTLRIGGLLKTSVVNGPGSRYVIFTSGCNHDCKGCHNQPLQDYTYGREITIDELIQDVVKYYHVGLIQGITLSGGEPVDQHDAIVELMDRLKEYGIDDIWIYSGYTYEQIESISPQILTRASVLIDGKFDIDYYDTNVKYRGSSNQRIIDLQNSTINDIKELEI